MDHLFIRPSVGLSLHIFKILPMDHHFFIRPINGHVFKILLMDYLFAFVLPMTHSQHPTHGLSFFIRPTDGQQFKILPMDYLSSFILPMDIHQNPTDGSSSFLFVLLMDIHSISYRLIVIFFIRPIDGHTLKILPINDFHSSYR